MKAIVKVKKASGFSKHNGHTFEVKEVLTSLIALLIPDETGKLQTVDFTHKEVLIVDLEKELQKTFDSWNWGADLRTYPNMVLYAKENKLMFSRPEYNCLA
jgi:hypothetical protein